MRPVLVVVGVLVTLMGAVWAFQGAGYLLGSFMSNDPAWLWIGVVTAALGAALAVFGVRKGPPTKVG